MVEFLAIRNTIAQMIKTSDIELDSLLTNASVKTYKSQVVLNKPNKITNEIFFINKGLLRTVISDHDDQEHTIHFALENQFIADYCKKQIK